MTTPIGTSVVYDSKLERPVVPLSLCVPLASLPVVAAPPPSVAAPMALRAELLATSAYVGPGARTKIEDQFGKVRPWGVSFVGTAAGGLPFLGIGGAAIKNFGLISQHAADLFLGAGLATSGLGALALATLCGAYALVESLEYDKVQCKELPPEIATRLAETYASAQGLEKALVGHIACEILDDAVARGVRGETALRELAAVKADFIENVPDALRDTARALYPAARNVFAGEGPAGALTERELRGVESALAALDAPVADAVQRELAAAMFPVGAVHEPFTGPFRERTRLLFAFNGINPDRADALAICHYEFGGLRIIDDAAVEALEKSIAALPRVDAEAVRAFALDRYLGDPRASYMTIPMEKQQALRERWSTPLEPAQLTLGFEAGL